MKKQKQNSTPPQIELACKLELGHKRHDKQTNMSYTRKARADYKRHGKQKKTKYTIEACAGL